MTPSRKREGERRSAMTHQQRGMGILKCALERREPLPGMDGYFSHGRRLCCVLWFSRHLCGLARAARNNVVRDETVFPRYAETNVAACCGLLFHTTRRSRRLLLAYMYDRRQNKYHTDGRGVYVSDSNGSSGGVIDPSSLSAASFSSSRYASDERWSFAVRSGSSDRLASSTSVQVQLDMPVSWCL